MLTWTDLSGGDWNISPLWSRSFHPASGSFSSLEVLFIQALSGKIGGLTASYELVATSVWRFLGMPLAAAALSRFTYALPRAPTCLNASFAVPPHPSHSSACSIQSRFLILWIPRDSNSTTDSATQEPRGCNSSSLPLPRLPPHNRPDNTQACAATVGRLVGVRLVLGRVYAPKRVDGRWVIDPTERCNPAHPWSKDTKS